MGVVLDLPRDREEAVRRFREAGKWCFSLSFGAFALGLCFWEGDARTARPFFIFIFLRGDRE
jgi:hypothetical protein